MMDLETARTTLGEEFTMLSKMIEGQLDALGLDQAAKVLDVGTGMGRMAITLALSGYKVLTGEPEADQSEYAKQPWFKEAQQVGAADRITYQAFDAEKMPFDSGRFDAIFMVGALHHIHNPATAVAECVRVMAPGGVLCIMEPNAKLLERARTRFPTHPDAEDPRCYAQGLSVQLTQTELFDVYLIRR